MRPPMLRAGGFGITSAVAARSLTQLQLSATKSMITPHVGRKFRFGKLYIHSIYLNFYETQKKEMKKKSEKKIIKPAGNSEGYKSKAEKMAAACHVYLLQKSGVHITVGMEKRYCYVCLLQKSGVYITVGMEKRCHYSLQGKSNQNTQTCLV